MQLDGANLKTHKGRQSDAASQCRRSFLLTIQLRSQCARHRSRVDCVLMTSMPPAQHSAVQLLTTVEECDIPAIHALYTSAYNDGLWPTNPTLQSLTRRIHTALLTLTLTLTPATSPLSSVIGFLLLTGSPSDPLLEDVVVLSSHRGGGYGRRLVEAMQATVIGGQLAGGGGVSRVECYCGWAVKGFYQRCGFVVVRGEQGGRCLMRWPVPGN